jgi:hypothetical protein
MVEVAVADAPFSSHEDDNLSDTERYARISGRERLRGYMGTSNE